MQDALLLVSEVVTNAVVHGEPPIVMSVEVDPTAFEAEIVDGGATHFPVSSRPTPDSATSGRGLQILNTLAVAWGIDLAPDNGGLRVWFKLPIVAKAL